MSPPCQPFTRNNTTEARDTNDPRAKAFENIIDLIPRLRIPPHYIALEVSISSTHLYSTLTNQLRMSLASKNLIAVRISFKF